MFRLMITDGGEARAVDLGDDGVTIGRADTNTVRLPDENVSRYHARLERRDGAWVIHDLASYNGVSVNGRRITGPVSVTHGDQIWIGEYALALEDSDKGSVVPRPPSQGDGDDGDDGGHEPLFDPILRMPDVLRGGSSPPPEELPTFKMTASVEQLQAAAAKGAVPPTVRPMRLVFLSPVGVPPVGLDQLPVTIGSGEQAVARLAAGPAEQATVFVQEGELLIEDRTEGEWVRVNDSPCRRGPLALGDIVTLGDAGRFRVGRRSHGAVVVRAAPRSMPPPASMRTASRIGMWAAVASAVLVSALALYIWYPRDSGTPDGIPAAVGDAGAVSDAAAVANTDDAEGADDAGSAIPLGAGETVEQRVERASEAMEEVDFDQVLALLAPLRERADMSPEAGTRAALLETSALVATHQDTRAVEACRRAVQLSGDPDIARDLSPRIRTACRAAAAELGLSPDGGRT